MISYDISATEELIVSDGDFLPIESDGQHITAILKAGKGNFIAAPTLGVEIDKMQNAPTTNRVIEQTIRENLKKDNYSINKLRVTNEFNDIAILIDATKLR